MTAGCPWKKHNTDLGGERNIGRPGICEINSDTSEMFKRCNFDNAAEEELSSFLTENTLRLHCEDWSVNAI
jgi:hypothetical protein